MSKWTSSVLPDSAEAENRRLQQRIKELESVLRTLLTMFDGGTWMSNNQIAKIIREHLER
jgi:hypothetical protein